MQNKRRFSFLAITFGFVLCLVGYSAQKDISLDFKMKDPFYFLRESQLPEIAKIKKHYDHYHKLGGK